MRCRCGSASRFVTTGLTEIWTEDANALPHGGVHFGYRDGIAQPEIAGANPRDRPDMQPKASPGDFLLGRDYVNAFGGNYLGNLLPALGNNATYAAFRVLRQDVPAFEQLLDAVGRANGAWTGSSSPPSCWDAGATGSR